MKAIELLKDYRNIDFGCDVEQLHSDIDEAIAELEELERLGFKLVDSIRVMKEHVEMRENECNTLIVELEALQSRSCERCSRYTTSNCPVEEFSITSAELEKYPFYCNRWEAKQ